MVQVCEWPDIGPYQHQSPHKDAMMDLTKGPSINYVVSGGAHCTEIDFALSFGAVIVKMIDLSKTESRDFFGIILGQENSQKLYLLPKSC